MNSACAVVVVALVASTWGKPQPEAEPQQGFGAGRGGRRLFDDVPPPSFNRGPPGPNDFAGGFDDDLDFNQGFTERQVGNHRFNEPRPFIERPNDNFDLGPLDFEARQQNVNGNQRGQFEQDFSNQPNQFGFSNEQQGFDKNPGFSQSDFDINQQDTFDDMGFGIEQNFNQQRGGFGIEQDAIIPEPSGFGNQQVPFGQGEPSFGDPQENFAPTSQRNRFPQESRIQQENRVPQTNRVTQINRIPQRSIATQSNRVPQANRVPQTNRLSQRNRIPPTNTVSQNNRTPQESRIIQGIRNQPRNRIPQTDVNQQQFFAQDRENIGSEPERFGSQQNTQREVSQRIPNQQTNIRTEQRFGNQQEIVGQEQQRFAPVSDNTRTGQQRQRNEHPITRQRTQDFPSQQDFIEDERFGGFQQNAIRPQQAALNRGQEGATLINGGQQNQDRIQPDPDNFQQIPEEDLQTFPNQQSFLGPQSGNDRQQGIGGNQQSFGPSRAGPGTSQQGFGSQQGSNRGQGQTGRREQPGSGGIRTRQQNFNETQGFSDGSISRQQQNIASRQDFNGNERRNNNRRQPNFNSEPNSINSNQQNFNEQGGFRTNQQGISSRPQDFNRQQPILPQGGPEFNRRSGFIRPEENFDQEQFQPAANQPRNNAARQGPVGPVEPRQTNSVANNINRFPISQPGNGQQSFDNRQQGFGGSQQSFSGQRGFGRSRQGTIGSQQGFGNQQNLSN